MIVWHGLCFAELFFALCRKFHQEQMFFVLTSTFAKLIIRVLAIWQTLSAFILILDRKQIYICEDNFRKTRLTPCKDDNAVLRKLDRKDCLLFIKD